ncbi:hypothetical protein INT43_005847 [Umbelopsis isabellina]|uniref:Cap-specific mRNA (nucleoside-2'-O-)-methyltransferase 1 n=1 Tax=Mortierella isabellina TaxID=91625 RepID=A0A8H7U9L4_MORIS|nr:hypothetical protein INT43_005847 [Umbelopsis isabellina]
MNRICTRAGFKYLAERFVACWQVKRFIYRILDICGDSNFCHWSNSESMADPFTDNDPDYRNTRVDSGIPPPSLATIPRVAQHGQKRDRYSGQPENLTSWNPKQQRRDTSYQRHEDPYNRQDRRGDQYQRYERRPDDRGSRDDPRYRQDQDRHRHEQEYRRHEDYRRQEHDSRRREQDSHCHEDYRRHESQYAHPEKDSHGREQDSRRHPYDEQSQRSYHHPSHQSHSESNKYDSPAEQSNKSEELPPPLKPIAAEFKMNTDFLACGEDDACAKLSSVEDIAKHLEIKYSELDDPVDYEFVSSADLAHQVTEAKNRLSGTKHELFTLARSRTNPFDKIGQAIFICRAATKLAVLDVHFNLLASPDSNQTFQFADLCGGPGGFSEYLLWRAHTSGQAIHGYGITLKGENDKNWRLDAFHPDTDVKHSFTILDGKDHSGDICIPDNLANFASHILQQAANGVDLVVADGGTNFQGQQDKQELIARQLLICQTAAMLSVLRKGGKFVCKFFDITLETTAGLVWILYQCFESICITKPLTSRPANAERYIICNNFRFHRPQVIIDYLLKVNEALSEEHARSKRVNAIVERGKMESDEAFIDYMKMRNMKFAIKQLEALENLEQFVQRPHNGTTEPDQNEVRRRCLHEWRLPLQKESK